ncbi:chemotaxis protein methyltransferase CheR [Azospira oryzae]|uniref:Chemotaxis protein methyltransferase n=1 Tax=Azospira oryzae TaxID=146939 RepID=A0ABY0IMH3_9RHOO|nr:protein-glutamate O-methyltransferase CheR [Azospira oryzae]RZT75875.1 chemotaxis protein methyltransferase CheR [Azospira oryzae]
MDGPSGISDQEFGRFRDLIYQIAGIQLSDAKKVLLVGRLSRRLKHYGLSTFAQYYQLVTSPQESRELQTMVDLLTTNETYFFREPKHFDYLAQEILPHKAKPGVPFNIWSAACSSGEEPYTLAMVLAEHLGNRPWQVVGSDISTVVLAKAQAGHYPLERTEGIPPQYLKKYCLKGVRSQEGTLLVAKELRERVRFLQVNLTKPAPDLGPFDVIFLRNVMIYFDMETKRKVVENLITRLKPGGTFIVGHSESLNGITDRLKCLRPTIYEKH